MKKILYLIGIMTFVLTSCSSDDSSEIFIKKSKLTKIVYVTLSTGAYSSVDFKYDGNHIKSETYNDGTYAIYTYEGDFITKKEMFSANKQLTFETEYKYIDGKLASKTDKYPNNGGYLSRIKYNYKTGIVYSEQFTVIEETGEEIEFDLFGTFTYKEGNLLKSELRTSISESIYTCEYDTKNNPLKNITGMNLLTDKDYQSSFNNITKLSGDGYLDTFTYAYNENDFPTQSKCFDKEGELKWTAQYYYEQE
ncbi:hypothetical protein [Flavobacterium sp. LAR06]|uniref:hypothetical protein n=1 Tax=Flavobacterium sp. LAR06 TaxID=3064897 RepID=UPI0035BF9D90